MFFRRSSPMDGEKAGEKYLIFYNLDSQQQHVFDGIQPETSPVWIPDTNSFLFVNNRAIYKYNVVLNTQEKLVESGSSTTFLGLIKWIK
jgi:hypothetical protein